MPTSTIEPLAQLYISRVAPVAPHLAAAAFDSLLGGSQVLRCSTGSLLLRSTTPRPRTSPFLLRSMRGTVSARGRSAPVELELAPWSASSVEVGLRPMSKVWQATPPEACLVAGHDLVDLVVAILVIASPAG
jgi:hypothetical protein